jgi:hypothetical protein
MPILTMCIKLILRKFNYFMLFLTAVMISTSTATAQSLNGVKIGDLSSTLETLDLQLKGSNTNGNFRFTKFNLSNGNDLSITYNIQTNKILYIETDWNQKFKARASGVSSFVFGSTTLEDIRKINGSNGFSWKKLAVQQDDNQVMTFNAYEISQNSDSVVVFVTRLDIPKYRAASDIDKEKKFAKFFKLDAIILANKQYLDQIWGEEKLYDRTNQPINWQE